MPIKLMVVFALSILVVVVAKSPTFAIDNPIVLAAVEDAA